MSKQFKGHVLDDNGIGIGGVKVTITGTGVPADKFTTTDSTGSWLLTLQEEVNSIDITLTFSKPGFGTRTITNPQPTAELSGYIDPNRGGVLDLAGLYDSGKWKVTSLKTEVQDILNQEIKDIYKFVSDNPGNYILEIESSESKVPNADNEEGKKRDNEFKTIPGSLAKARATALKEYVDKELSKLYAQDSLAPDVIPVVSFGVIDNVGGDDWDGIDADATKYKQFQYTRIKARFITEPDIDISLDKFCFSEFKLQINYTGGGHTCNAAVFKVYVNDILIYRDDGKGYASLNNKTQVRWLDAPVESNQYRLASLDNQPGDIGGERYNQFTINKTLAKQLLDKNPNGYLIILECTNPTNITEEEDPAEGSNGYEGNCHKGVGTIKVISPDGSESTLDITTPGQRDLKVPMALLDPCNPLIYLLDPNELKEGIKIKEAEYWKSISDKKLTQKSKYRFWFYMIEVHRKSVYFQRIPNYDYEGKINDIISNIKKLKRTGDITEDEYNKLINLTKGVGSYYNENTNINSTIPSASNF